MKKKITALTLTLILTLSSTAFAADVTYNSNNFNIFNWLPFNNTSTNLNNTANEKTTEPNYTTTENTTSTSQVNSNRTTNVNSNTSSNSSYERKVAELVNVERQKAGMPALTLDSAISNVARTKSKDMADNNYFAHQSPTYGSAGDMMKKFGINWSAWGENIASGQRSPEEVVNAWMNSSGHRANILSSNFSKIGVGYATDSNGKPYWTQMFTN